MNNENHITVSLTSGTIVRTLLFLLLLFLLYRLFDVVLVILTAIVIASAIEPATKTFEKYKIPRVVGVLGIYVLVTGFLVSILFWFLPPLVQDISAVIAKAPEYLSSLDAGGVFGQGFVGGSDALSSLKDRFADQTTLSGLQSILGSTSAGVFGFLSGVFGGVLNFVLIVSISFYLAVQKDGIASFLRIVTPIRYESYIIDLWRRSQEKIGKWLQGQLILMLIIGILTYLGLSILGVKNAFLLAILAGMFELIPLFGPILSAVPAVALGLIDGGIALAAMVLGLFIIIQQFENHLLHPIVVKKVVGVPALVVILSLVIGGTLAGFLGIILSVPIAAALMEYANDLQARKKEYHDKESKQPTLI